MWPIDAGAIVLLEELAKSNNQRNPYCQSRVDVDMRIFGRSNA